MRYVDTVRCYKGEDLNEMFNLYPVNISKVEDEKFLTDFGDSGEEWVLISQKDIDSYDSSVYNAVDWGDLEFDEYLHDEVCNNIIKKAPRYLVFASGCRWNGASGYKFTDTFDESLYRGYDTSLCINSVSKGGKVLRLTEYSHDVPTGSDTYVIALTDKEAERLEYVGFPTIEHFVEKCPKSLSILIDTF